MDFASVLVDLGLRRDTLVTALLGFNLGVELGNSLSLVCFCRLPLRYDIPGVIGASAWVGFAANRGGGRGLVAGPSLALDLGLF